MMEHEDPHSVVCGGAGRLTSYHTRRGGAGFAFVVSQNTLQGLMLPLPGRGPSQRSSFRRIMERSIVVDLRLNSVPSHLVCPVCRVAAHPHGLQISCLISRPNINVLGGRRKLPLSPRANSCSSFPQTRCLHNCRYPPHHARSAPIYAPNVLSSLGGTDLRPGPRTIRLPPGSCQFCHRPSHGSDPTSARCGRSRLSVRLLRLMEHGYVSRALRPHAAGSPNISVDLVAV